MFIIGNFIKAAATVIDYILIFYMYIVLARAVLSWVSPDPYNPIVRFIHNITEPVLHQIRKRIPLNFGGIEFLWCIIYPVPAVIKLKPPIIANFFIF